MEKFYEKLVDKLFESRTFGLIIAISVGLVLVLIGIGGIKFQSSSFAISVENEIVKWILLTFGGLLIFYGGFGFLAPIFFRNWYYTRLQNKAYTYFPDRYSPSLSFGLEHIDSQIFSHYSDIFSPTIGDKKEAMSSILRQICLTSTPPGTIDNLIRAGVFEVRNNYKFKLLAVDNIDLHRIPKIERSFSWDPHNGESIVGYTVNQRKSILIADLDNAPPEISKWFKQTDENRLKNYQTKCILCVPVFDKDISNPDAKCIAVISISSSQVGVLKEKHQKEVEQYAIRVRNLLTMLNGRILFDPEEYYGVRAITVSGEVGSGKTTLATDLISILEVAGWKRLNVGAKFREFCEQNNYSIEQIENLGDEVHEKFDEFQKSILAEEEKIIVESRLSGFLAYELGMKDILSVFCFLPFDERVARVVNREIKTRNEVEVKIKERDEKDLKRYQKLYNVKDYRNHEYYKLYLTTNKPSIELAREVLNKMKSMGEIINKP
jgi:CMP/dCMP kinase